MNSIRSNSTPVFAHTRAKIKDSSDRTRTKKKNAILKFRLCKQLAFSASGGIIYIFAGSGLVPHFSMRLRFFAAAAVISRRVSYDLIGSVTRLIRLEKTRRINSDAICGGRFRRRVRGRALTVPTRPPAVSGGQWRGDGETSCSFVSCMRQEDCA
jgi:hypothetical protein